MKRMLCMVLALAVALSLTIPAFAANSVNQSSDPQTATTTVTYAATTSETWTVSVPATLNPGGSGDVTANGQWPLNKKLTVTTDNSVTMKNTGSPDKTLAVTFNTFELLGSNVVSVSKEQPITVGNWSEGNAPLFGTWTGTITYTVALGAAS